MRMVCRTSDLQQQDYFKLVSVLEAEEGRPFVFSERMLLVNEKQVRKDVSLGEDLWFVSLIASPEYGSPGVGNPGWATTTSALII